MTTRDRILKVAYRAFAENGYARTSMGAIAKELGITRPALYYHFASKEDLLMATYQTVDPLVDANVEPVLDCDNAVDFRKELCALIGSITANLRNDEQRAQFVATVESASRQIPAVRESAQAQYNVTCVMFEEALEHGKAVGAVDNALDTAAAGQLLAIYIYGIGDVLLRGCKVDLVETRNMAVQALLGLHPAS